MISPEELSSAVRAVLAEKGSYLSTRQVLERLSARQALLAQCGSEALALRRIKDTLLELQGELSFDFVPSGRRREVLGSKVEEVTIVFRLRG